jgi:tetratricopeptide (TPR) repeat protein
MKTIKYLFVGALMLSFGTPVMAQSELSPVDALKEILKNKPADADKQIKAIYKNNKKDMDVVVGMARAFYEAGDTVNARVYAEYATAKKEPGGYVVLGDLYALADDGGRASAMYNSAIIFAKQKGGQIDPAPYYKYAVINRKVAISDAIGKLDELAQERPDLQSNGYISLLKGRIYDLANKVEDAAKTYAQVPLDMLEERDIVSAARANYLLGDYAKSQEVIEQGLRMNPRKFTYNQLGMFNHTQLKNYDKALEYADRMLNHSDSVKTNPEIFGVYAKALNGAKRHEEAIKVYKDVLEMEFDSQDKKAGAIKDLADAFKGIDDYENALFYYDQFLKTVSHATLSDYADMGRLYVQYADGLEGDAKMENLKKADQIYADLAEKNADAKEYSLFWRGRVNTMMDPESKDGLARPYYEELANIINEKAEKDKADTARLIESCRYMINYHLNVLDEKDNAKKYAEIILSVDPENEIGKMVMELK